MPDKKHTTLTIKNDWPVAISSSAHGTGVDSVGFNLAFIALKNPKLAVDIMKIYSEASQIRASDPEAPDEDMKLYAKELRDFLLDSDK